ncbi:MAG: hypothetical protein HY881_03375 [Deltaproteobacteria bacterium]|nr:hypothetical protein [Deltaproteobacteria bacterium]
MVKSISGLTKTFLALTIAASLVLGMHGYAAAHCDTLDGPVIQDARKALDTKDVTPVLKWVRSKDEKSVKDAFNKALSARGQKQQEAAEIKSFETLVRIHRAGEGASFSGLKPAGEVEPAIAEADKALADGTADSLVKIITDTVTRGIRQRYEKAAEALKHKDESVQKGREFVAAYVEYTHYVERLSMDAGSESAHHAEGVHKKHAPPEHKHGD